MTYSNPSVVARIARDEGVPAQTAELWFQEALKFLELAAELKRSQRTAVPSAPVDAAWHAFILHTRDYAEYCERELGTFVHHRPAEPGGSKDPAAAAGAYLSTRDGIERRYGSIDATVWPLP